MRAEAARLAARLDERSEQAARMLLKHWMHPTLVAPLNRWSPPSLLLPLPVYLLYTHSLAHHAACFRCGRRGHWISQCFAHTHASGGALSPR